MAKESTFSLAIHGGAGVISREKMTPEAKIEYHIGLQNSLKEGFEILRRADGTALEAVTAAVVAMEDNPLFNAGRGAVFTAEGKFEMDAALMDGRQRKAGAVAGIVGPRNPILAARAVMEKSPHVLLTGEGATRFCKEHGVPFADFLYFYTDARWHALISELERRRCESQEMPDAATIHGTVGAVALDRNGNLAAATSTGGTTAKLPGRIGDSPIFGAGTWADNDTCAVSATGIGELFIRCAAAHEVDARMRYRGDSLEKSVADVMATVGVLGGEGGLIAVDRVGVVAMSMNGDGMYRGRIGTDGIPYTAIFCEEVLD